MEKPIKFYGIRNLKKISSRDYDRYIINIPSELVKDLDIKEDANFAVYYIGDSIVYEKIDKRKKVYRVDVIEISNPKDRDSIFECVFNLDKCYPDCPLLKKGKCYTKVKLHRRWYIVTDDEGNVLEVRKADK